MSSTEDFFLHFQNSVIDANQLAEGNEDTCLRIPFFMYQFSMVPDHLEEMFCNMLRTYPTFQYLPFSDLDLLELTYHGLVLLGGMEPIFLIPCESEHL